MPQTEAQLRRQHMGILDSWPHDRWGEQYRVETNRGAGHAKCTCGELSEEEFDSTRQRRAWQIDHRNEAVARKLGTREMSNA